MMKLQFHLALMLTLASEAGQACATHAAKASTESWAAFKKSYKKPSSARLPAQFKPVPDLPYAEGHGALSPWGGPTPQRWRPEAVAANAASGALNDLWRLPGVTDVIIALPVKMLRSSYHPYGDGQSNAALTFGNFWRESRPPFMASLVRFASAPSRVYFRLDRSLSSRVARLFVSYSRNGKTEKIALSMRTKPSGDAETDWVPPPELDWNNPTQTNVVFAQPEGWTDSFPVFFRHPAYPMRKLLEQVPAEMRKFADGRSLYDPELLGMANGGRQTPFEKLMSHKFGSGFNTVPYTPDNIHARYPTANGTVTAVGQGWTWLTERPVSPFKILYTCFERRNPNAEAAQGVPSGGGWHEIGDGTRDHIETIMNTLESEPVLVGFATTNPGNAPAQGGFAYGLPDIATLRFLRPGETQVTSNGKSPWGYPPGFTPPSDRANFHWFAFQQPREVCTLEWVHPSLPSPGDPLGLK